MQVKCPFVSPHCTLKTLGITAICSKWFDPYATLFIFLKLTYRYRCRCPISRQDQGIRAGGQWRSGSATARNAEHQGPTAATHGPTV